jgi:hypothetical protein
LPKSPPPVLRLVQLFVEKSSANVITRFFHMNRNNDWPPIFFQCIPASIRLNIPILRISTESLVVNVAVHTVASRAFKLIDLFRIASAIASTFVVARNMRDFRFAKRALTHEHLRLLDLYPM